MKRILLIGAFIAATASILATRSWSRDSEGSLVYATPSDYADSQQTVWRSDSDGSHSVRLAKGTAPQLSPNGREVAFLRRPGGHDHGRGTLMLVAATGGSATPLRAIRGASHYMVSPPVWAPDSRHLVSVEYPTGLVLLDSVNETATAVARAVPRRSGVASPSFSPDSGSLVYTRVDQTGSDLYSYNIAARSTRQITHDHESSMPVWGARLIAFARGLSGGDIWVMHSDGTGVEKLTSTNGGLYPIAWSADSNLLLAASDDGHNHRLWRVDVRSKSARPVTRFIGDLYAQGLSKDGTTILAGRGCGGNPADFGLVETMSFSGGSPRVIVRGPCRASWDR